MTPDPRSVTSAALALATLVLLAHTGTVDAIMHRYQYSYRGIYQGFSGPGIKANQTMANLTCNQETVFGRPGRLARSLDAVENELLRAMMEGYEPVMMDGTDRMPWGGGFFVTGGWYWSPRDYSTHESGEWYWNPATNIMTGQFEVPICWRYCNWGEGEPYIGHAESPLDELQHSLGVTSMRADGKWFDTGLSEVHSFFCEFPCRNTADCPAPGPCETVRCEFPNYRCEYPPRPAGYVCGASTGTCDAPELCNGVDGSCPYQNNGVCNDHRIVSFWYSQTESATPAQAATRCAQLSYQGKTGRLARVTSGWENDRIQTLKGSADWDVAWLDGSDAGHEGSFRWSDNYAFWDGSGCHIDWCSWDTNQPDNWQTGESQLEIWGNGKWNDNKDSVSHAFVCEFPCANVGQCPPPELCETVICSAWGRCLYTNKPDGTICAPSLGDCNAPKRCDGSSNLCRLTNGVCNTDRIMTFYWSQFETTTPAQAAYRCSQVSYQGKAGRLARVTSWWERDRMQYMKGTGTTAMLDGSDAGHEGSWRWSDGFTFWDGAGCKIESCPWDTNQPSNSFLGESQLEIWGNGQFNDYDANIWHSYICEFPCANAGQCPEPAACENVVCSAWGRCLYSVKANGVICRNGGGDCDAPERCDGSSAQCPAQNGLCNTDNIITFWWSQNEATTLAQASARCSALSYQGKTGRLARVTSWWENDRMQNLKGWGTTAIIEGSDAGHEGSWRWPDGFTFWDGGGCHMEYCAWDWGQPDNYWLGENALVIWGNGLWNDYDGLVPWSYMCEFPCQNAGQCPAPGPCQNVVCSGWGRCLYSGGC